MCQMLLVPEHYISEEKKSQNWFQNSETKWNWKKNTKYVSWNLLDECT